MWLKKLKKRFHRNETKKGTRVKNFQKEKKRKLPWNKNGIKYDLKYIHKKLSMNLQFRGENEHSLNILLNTNIKSVIMCVPSRDSCTNHFVLGLLVASMKLWLKACRKP